MSVPCCSNDKRGSDRLIEHIEVVCPSDRPMNGRKKDDPVPVKKFAQRCGLKVFETPSHLKSLKTWDFPVTDMYDVGVVVSFGYFLVCCFLLFTDDFCDFANAHCFYGYFCSTRTC